MFHKLTFLSMLLAAAALTGCKTTAEHQNFPNASQQVQTMSPSQQSQPLMTQQAVCEPELVAFAIGEEVTTELIEQVRQKTGATVIRILLPNQPATLELNPGRVNVLVNTGYVIRDIACF